MGLLDSIAAKGRNGDTRLAHLTPGEVVIPKEVAALRPDLVAHVGNQIRKMGGNPNTIVAGRGRVNPQTGIEEFATEDEVKAAYQQYLGRAPDEGGLKYWLGQNDLSGFSKAASAELQQRAPEIQKTVSQAYRDNFGREAETTGSDYWTSQITSGKLALGNFGDTFKKAAVGEDAKALGDGAKYDTAWRTELDPNKDTLTYDADKNVWNPKQNPVLQQMQYAPNFNSTMNDATDTIEGRIQKLLAENSPVIRQAGERATQAFADRGLLNSSMAQQAAQEAMISKAIDIAGPDAERYFQNRWKNTDWNNKFAMNEQLFNYDMLKLGEQNKYATEQNANQQSLNMQTNYQSAISNIDNLYKQQVLAVQGADMEPQDKANAVEGIRVMRDNSIRLMTATFKQFPGWSSEWSKLVDLLG